MQKIASKLIQVMAECSQIPKNGVNDFHHYINMLRLLMCWKR